MNIAQLHEAIADVIPDQECIVFRDRRFTWQQVTDRTRRFAAVMEKHGLGCSRERASLNNWESGQDHVGLYLLNGNEYLEGLLGCFKSRTAPFNVNYRYVEEELLYLFENAEARAIVFHARFAPTLERIKDRLQQVVLWLQVADESGEPLMAGALDYEAALAAAEPKTPSRQLSADDLYIVYTGGTTGMPKGVLWRQEDIFYAALLKGGQKTTIKNIVAEILAHHEDKRVPIGFPSPPLMHATAQWMAMSLWVMGGTVVLQSIPERLDAHDVWETVEKERVGSMAIVGDAFALPLLNQLKKRKYQLGHFKLIVSGGAILSPPHKRALFDELPQVTILDTLGSSETGAQASQCVNMGHSVSTTHFVMKAGAAVLNEGLSAILEKGTVEKGWAARKGHVPLGYYQDDKKTAKTFPVIGGDRYSVPGDRVIYTAEGDLKLLGRDSVTINTGGEKVFAEEVEQALKNHPAVFDTVVVGVEDKKWGQAVTALVRFAEGETVDEEVLKDLAGKHLAGYKVPKLFLTVQEIVRSPSGKPDYRWAKEIAQKLTMEAV